VTICSWVFAGKVSFNRRSLHAIGNETNPYEQALNIIGQTLSPFDEDNLIPCFGFGDGASSSLQQLESLSIQSESLKHFFLRMASVYCKQLTVVDVFWLWLHSCL
jgi:hypothetical protein